VETERVGDTPPAQAVLVLGLHPETSGFRLPALCEAYPLGAKPAFPL